MKLRRPSLTAQILVALIVGALLGWLWPEMGKSLQILATIFIRLVLVIIAPLIFSTLVVGIAGQGDLRRLGSLAFQTAAYFVAITALALLLSFGLANFMKPGDGVITSAASPVELVEPPAESFWIRIIPSSIVDAMARGDVLQIVLFSILMAIAVSLAGEPGRMMLEWCRSLAQVMYKLTDLVMLTAPVGVLGAAAALVAQQGIEVGASFLRLMAAVYIGLGILLFVVFPVLALIFRLSLGDIYRAIKDPFAIAFATSSASAALPKAMENMEKIGVPRSVVAFLMPTGLSFNPVGSTVFIGVASLFIIQAFQIPLSSSDQIVLFGTLYVASKGIAGVPRSSLVVITAGLSSMGIAPEIVGAGIGLLLGIDPLFDMPRTATNTTGNCLASAIVGRWQESRGPDG